jgi:hypothetical protein
MHNRLARTDARQRERRPVRVALLAVLATVLTSSAAAAQESGASTCERLARVTMPATTITETRLVAAGTFAGPPAPFSGRDMRVVQVAPTVLPSVGQREAHL